MHHFSERLIEHEIEFAFDKSKHNTFKEINKKINKKINCTDKLTISTEKDFFQLRFYYSAITFSIAVLV